MASTLRINPADLYESQEKQIGYAIESAAVGCEGRYLRAHPNGYTDSIIDKENSIGHNMLWIVETKSGGTRHLGRQVMIRNAQWPDKYLHVSSHSPGRYKLDCKFMEEDNDSRAHFFFVRLRPDSNALAIGSVGYPGMFIEMDRGTGRDGCSGVVNCHLGPGTSCWFYLMQVEI